MESYKTVDQFLSKHSEWEKELLLLRSIVNETDLKETIKWGFPVYTINSKNVIGLGAFKAYVGLWFFQGALLKDPLKVLVNAQEGKTIAMRQWRFLSIDTIDRRQVLNYLTEAIENQKQGREIKPKKTKPLIIPKELIDILQKDTALHANFAALNLTRKREFAEHIASAKQKATRIRRLEKIIPMIHKGIGLNDKYR